MVWLENKFSWQLPAKNEKIYLYFHSPRHLSILNIGKFFSSGILKAKLLYEFETLETIC